MGVEMRKKKDKRGRRRQKVFGALCLIAGITLISVALLQFTGVFPEATVTLGSLLPAQLAGLRVYITPATLTFAGVGFSFIGSALLMGLCGLCLCCIKSGFSNREIVHYLTPIRAYRNIVLNRSWYGRVFIWLYYHVISPLAILFIWVIPFDVWKRKLGLWLIPRLSRWCRRRVKNGKKTT